jgi:hypothetical protein
VLYCKNLLTKQNIPFRGWFLGYDECDQPKIHRRPSITGPDGTGRDETRERVCLCLCLTLMSVVVRAQRRRRRDAT